MRVSEFASRRVLSFATKPAVPSRETPRMRAPLNTPDRIDCQRLARVVMGIPASWRPSLGQGRPTDPTIRRAQDLSRAMHAQRPLRRGAGFREKALAQRRTVTEALGAIALVTCASLPAPLHAQSDSDSRGPPNLATLQMWVEDVWLALTDRDGSYFGRLADEGTFQRFNPLMDHEYELDVRTGMFTPSEEARWASSRRGVRASGASIGRSLIMTDLELREAVPISGPVELGFHFVRQHSLTARRDHPRVGLRWNGVGGSPWNLSTWLGVHFFKPSADVEVAVARRWGPPEGEWRLRVGLGLLDAFNDLIFEGLGVPPTEVDAHYDYTAASRAIRAMLQRTWGSTRVELHGGLTTLSRVLVTFPSTGDRSYTLDERVGFAGALAEARLFGRIAVSAYGTLARADTDRRFRVPSPENLELMEETRAIGGRARLGLTADVSVEGDLRWTWRPEDRHTGDGTRLEHDDRELFGQVALLRRPRVGELWRLAVAQYDRESTVFDGRLAGVQQRLTMEWGYRFVSDFEVVAGLRLDLDAFERAPFDGGHLRISTTW